MKQLQKIEQKIFDARDKKFNQKTDWIFSDWINTKYMLNLRYEWEQAVKKQEKESGILIDYNFSDLLC